MTIGVGGVSQQQALDKLTNMVDDINPIEEQEYCDRLSRAQQLMKINQLEAI